MKSPRRRDCGSNPQGILRDLETEWNSEKDLKGARKTKYARHMEIEGREVKSQTKGLMQWEGAAERRSAGCAGTRLCRIF